MKDGEKTLGKDVKDVKVSVKKPFLNLREEVTRARPPMKNADQKSENKIDRKTTKIPFYEKK